MKTVLFVLHNTLETRTSEFATLASLAETLRRAGFVATLLVVAGPDGKSVRVPYAASFETITATRAEADIGDGADYLLRLVEKTCAAKDVGLIVAFGNTANRNWAPQIAASLGAEYLTACETIHVVDEEVTVAGPVMGGLLQKTIALGDRKAVLLYAGDPLSAGSDPAESEVLLTVIGLDRKGVRFVRAEPLPDSGGIPLRGAGKIVSGGLGIGSGDKWRLIEDFAAKVEAAVGASRAAVEMGWVPSSRQVGFSGQKVSPDVYVAVGISGAVHHLAGIGGAKKVVAINKDPEANIFKVADIAIVGDYEQVLAAAMRKLETA
ncbi:electron transfer flavoprotein subunit alpha/FixB family protein [Bradyrhizobium sp. Arg314]